MIRIILILCFTVICPQPLQAGEFSTVIKTISFKKAPNHWYYLTIMLQYHLSPTAIRAIQSNIPLFWNLRVKIKQAQWGWNKTIFTNQYRYEIRYHPLLKTYSVHHQNKALFFQTLSRALASLAKLDDLKIIKVINIEKNKRYQLAIQLLFDREALPLPLRPLSYLDSEWDLSSDWYLWPLPP